MNHCEECGPTCSLAAGHENLHVDTFAKCMELLGFSPREENVSGGGDACRSCRRATWRTARAGCRSATCAWKGCFGSCIKPDCERCGSGERFPADLKVKLREISPPALQPMGSASLLEGVFSSQRFLTP